MSTPSTTVPQHLQPAAPRLAPPPPLTVPLARQLFILSFHLSQGEPILQYSLFRFIALARPHWRVSKEISQALVALAPAVRKLAERGVHTSFRGGPQIAIELHEQVANLAAVLERPPSVQPEDLFFRLLSEFIRRDHHYLCERSQRPREGWCPGRASPHHDPHFSFVCHYLLLRHRLGCPVLDELLAQMVAVFVARGPVFDWLMGTGYADELAQVIVAHNRAHPDAQVALPPDGKEPGR